MLLILGTPPCTGGFSFLSSFFPCPCSLDLGRELTAVETVLSNFVYFHLLLFEIKKAYKRVLFLLWPNSETKHTILHHYYKSQKSIHPISK